MTKNDFKEMNEVKKGYNLYSTIDMIFDPIYRKETYEYFDSIYKETDEEKTIFKSIRRKLKHLDE